MFEDGVDLSDGQWQRLALARAFMKEAPILVLDEPTASADPQAEFRFFQQVQERVRRDQEHTVLLISHRFANVRLADRIYVLDQGVVVASDEAAQMRSDPARMEQYLKL
jgi:ATP-binding cassette subfamily B protein